MTSLAARNNKPLKALPSLVRSAYAAAVSSGDVIFSETELTIVRTRSGVPFQLRLCPALAKKGGQRINDSNGTKREDSHDHTSNTNGNGTMRTNKPDPFDNPPPAMTIADLPPDHLLVLNKYPVIPRHFLLVTRDFKEQSGDLDMTDLAAMYGCLEAWRSSGEGLEERSEDRNLNNDRCQLYAFYNCGEHSGASQPHRHIQFLPVEDMIRDQERRDEWNLLLNGISSNASLASMESTAEESHSSPQLLPISYFTTPIPPKPSPEILHNLYLTLLRRARSQTASKTNLQSDLHQSSSSPSFSSSSPPTQSKISYNLGCTTNTMALCPRRKTGSNLRHPGKDEDIGIVELNGCLLAGTAMVKTSEEWTFLRDGKGRIDEVLRDVGFFEDVPGEGGGNVGVGVGVQIGNEPEEREREREKEKEESSRRVVGGAKETKI